LAASVAVFFYLILTLREPLHS